MSRGSRSTERSSFLLWTSDCVAVLRIHQGCLWITSIQISSEPQIFPTSSKQNHHIPVLVSGANQTLTSLKPIGPSEMFPSLFLVPPWSTQETHCSRPLRTEGTKYRTTTMGKGQLSPDSWCYPCSCLSYVVPLFLLYWMLIFWTEKHKKRRILDPTSLVHVPGTES